MDDYDDYEVSKLLGFVNLPVNDQAALQKFERFLHLVAERREGVINENERNWIMVRAYEEAYKEGTMEVNCEAAEVESIEILEARIKEYTSIGAVLKNLSALAKDQKVQDRLHMMALDLSCVIERIEDQIYFRKDEVKNESGE